MGKLIWRGWRTSIKDAPQPVGIVFGRNLKKLDKEKPENKARSDSPNVQGELPGKEVVPNDNQ
jgi:hypothetical protein